VRRSSEAVAHTEQRRELFEYTPRPAVRDRHDLPPRKGGEFCRVPRFDWGSDCVERAEIAAFGVFRPFWDKN
jgi:hypothetical protein